MTDAMQVEILADGTMKVTTGKVSMANHMSAEKFLRFASDLLGGTIKQVRRIGLNVGLQVALHDHASDGHTHTHN
jgi:hypothetical protein